MIKRVPTGVSSLGVLTLALLALLSTSRQRKRELDYRPTHVSYGHHRGWHPTDV